MIATVHVPATPPHRPGARAPGLLIATLRGACAMADDATWSVWRWYRIRASVRTLSGLDDHILEDIGVPRPCIIGATLRLVAEEEAVRRHEQT